MKPIVPSNDPYMISSTGEFAWINIPKNASSFVRSMLDLNEWKSCKKQDLLDPEIKKICVLRDPVDRWISGFSQTMHDRQVKSCINLLDDKDFWRVILINPVFDDHTEHQHAFVDGIDNLQYIYIQARDKEFGYIKNANKFYVDLANYISYTGGTGNRFSHWRKPINPSDSQSNKFEIFEKTRELVMKEYKSILEEHYKLDYLLLDQLTEFCYNEQNEIKEKYNE